MNPHTSRLPLLVAAALAAGCPDPDPGPPVEAGLCDAAWGPAPSAGRLHVDAAGADTGDGSEAAPLATLEAAVDASRTSGERQIVLGPGEFPASELLSADFGDNDLRIVGCGRDATTLLGDDAAPAIEVSLEATANIVLRDLTVRGGRRALVVRSGAGSAGPVRIERVDVVDAVRLGVLIDGVLTAAELVDVRVTDVANEGGEYGWGIAVQGRQPINHEPDHAQLLEGVEVADVEGIGVFVDGGWVDVRDSIVEGVTRTGDTLGRGIQLQNWSFGTLDNVVSADNHDSAVFLEKPGRLDPAGPGNTLAVELLDCTLGPTAPGAAADGEPADGLAATQFVPDGEEAFLASDLRVVIDGTDLSGNARAGILAETISVEVGRNNVFGKGTSFPLAAQAGAVVSGIGGEDLSVDPVELSGDAALNMARTPLELDELDD